MSDYPRGPEHNKKRLVQIDPLAVAETLGFQTFRRESRKPWSRKEDTLLTTVIRQLDPTNSSKLDPDLVDWAVVAQQISPSGLRKAKDCRKRWTNSLAPNLRKGKWTASEDEALLEAYKRHGPSWQKVSAEIIGRTDDQCAKRYTEVLDPSTKDRLKPWTREEDLRLIRQIKIHGTKWRSISADFPGRPPLTCRNRWRKLVTDVVRGKEDQIIKQEVDLITNGNTKMIENIGDDTSTNEETSSLSSYSTAATKRTRKSVDIHSKPAPSGITSQVNSEVEWRYTVGDKNPNPDPSLPHTLFTEENGGAIANQELVQYLISYAKSHDLDITVHQHIHHHYSPPQGNSNTTSPYAVTSPYGVLGNEDKRGPSPPTSNNTYYIEPETQINRYQHFNYLPPLTEVPKLNSSSAQSGTSSAKATHHHHHHHHHHHVPSKKKNEPESRESDLTKLLNENMKVTKSYPDTEAEESNALTPLTQAVEMAAAAEANNKRKLNGVSQDNKRAKHDASDEEEGMDFWETMRNLTDQNHAQSRQPLQIQPQQQPQQYNKPVSQHQPLQYFTESSNQAEERQITGTTLKEDEIHEIDEDVDQEALNSYGLFYNVYTREGSVLPDGQQQNQQEQTAGSVYDAWGGGFGIIPFNPS